MQIHHVALAVQEYEWYVRFCKEVLGMTETRQQGAAPHRQIWFAEGMQLNEVDQAPGPAVAAIDHISFKVEDIPAMKEKALAHGCHKVAGKGEHWFALPNGVLIEMK